MKFDVKFSKNNRQNTINSNDVITITIEANSFDNARKIARRRANEMGYVGKDGWKWQSTSRIM